MKKTIQLILCLSLPMMAMACGKGNPTSASLTTAEAMVSNTGDDSGENISKKNGRLKTDKPTS